MSFGRWASLVGVGTLALGSVAACTSETTEADAGSSDAGAPIAATSDELVQSKVVEPLEAECGSCHSDSRAEKGLVLSGLTRARLRERTVDVRAVEADTMVLVSPGNPSKSYLYLKIKGDLTYVACVAGCGSKMPLGKDYGAERLADLEKWIAEGAR